jgi:hypothetical protein
MTEQPTALRLADALEQPDDSLRWADGNNLIPQAAAELRRLHEENRKLKTVMVAAAEEISANWEAHCDSEGYGPANLMRRLEQGIASEYGYTAGAFAKLERINAQLLEALEQIIDLPEDSRIHYKVARRAIAAAKEKS